MNRCPHCRQPMPEQSEHERATRYLLSLGFTIWRIPGEYEIESAIGSIRKRTSQDLIDYARELGME